MPIKHRFVSQKQDGADETLVRPSDWNDDHVGSPVDIRIFTESGTWTKPEGCKLVCVEVIGAGGGGGGGAINRTYLHGGAGGGGGALNRKLFKASDLGSTESIIIGAGGTGGI